MSLIGIEEHWNAPEIAGPPDALPGADGIRAPPSTTWWRDRAHARHGRMGRQMEAAALRAHRPRNL